MRRIAALAAVVVVALAAGGCDESPTPAPVARTWPAGTVLAVDDIPIQATEVDAASVAVALIEPAASDPQLRRLALANVALPRAVAHALAPDEYERQRIAAHAALADLHAGKLVGPPRADGRVGETLSGGWTDLGLLTWSTALELPDGQWSDVIDEVGRFLIVRRLERSDGPVPMTTRVTVEALSFPWLSPDGLTQTIESAYDRVHLTIVDPDWRTIVPEHTQYRMGVHQP